uniref:Metalloendopeptidase n=1 Tax=Angiostrongylus cantonensis TaxID=6313 RepID=A0A0K0DBH0_ANGCA
MDTAFCTWVSATGICHGPPELSKRCRSALHEVKAIETAFASYTKKTCIRFQPRKDEVDFLNIVKGYGCYSQVGRTGGKQEISLGRGCLYHEIIVHELMHSLGFWHEHSRDDRDEHIRIRWENILPGMKSQFDKVSSILQDTQGEKYDYRSIMHYDSTAFSRNGRHTIETVEDGFTNINKLYQCPSIRRGNQHRTFPTTTTELVDVVEESCQDHFTDCLHFTQYCQRASFFFVMKTYCPQTCGHCTELDI